MDKDNMENICRTCFSVNSQCTTLNKFVENDGEDSTLFDILDRFVPQINVKKKIQFSTIICLPCENKLINSAKFKQDCIQSDKRFAELVGMPVEVITEDHEEIKKSPTPFDPLTNDLSLKLKTEYFEESNSNFIKGDELELAEFNDEVWSGEAEMFNESSNLSLDHNNEDEKKIKIRKKRIPKLKIKKFQNSSFSCLQCENVVYQRKKHLKLHLLEKHAHKDIENSIYSCQICMDSFKSEKNLKAHLMKHTCNSAADKIPDISNSTRPKKSVEEIIKKELIEITPQIIEESAQWFDNDDSDSDCSLSQKPSKISREPMNTDFIDTGVGEIEKPNFKNRRSGSYPCVVCGKIFDRPYRLKRHSSVHSVERPHECSICKYRFSTPNFLKSHMIQHENEANGIQTQANPEGFKCPDCPRRFEKKASLSAHRQIHTRSKPDATYACMVCGKLFTSVRSLTIHITNKHPDVEQHKCDQCDKTFVLHAHLLEHLNRHKGNQNLVCLICEKEFGYSNTLKEHMRVHSGESPFLCTECGKCFRSSSNLRQHMERHIGLKKYQCPDCPSRFNCRSDLIKHSTTHTNAKPHVCDLCGSSFTRSYSLQKHKQLHTGERPFKCDQCNMTFAMSYHLRRHTRTHTGEKPFKCKFCDRAYAESGDLTKHLRTHVGENTYMCEECPMAFKYQAELRQHQSEHYKAAQKLLEVAQNQAQVAMQDQTANESKQLPCSMEATHHNDLQSISEEISQTHLESSGLGGVETKLEIHSINGIQ